MDLNDLNKSMNFSGVELNPFLKGYEHEWVIHTSRTIEEDHEENEEQSPVSIFTIPKSLVYAKQEAYIPQIVAIGPYHPRRLDLYDMMRYKIGSAKRMQRLLRTGKFRDIVERFSELERHIRACYHKFLDYGSETLAWMMAVDAAFLLEYLQVCSGVKELGCDRVSSMLHLIDYTGRKYGHQAILRDVIMLENQIPLFLLRELFDFLQYENPQKILAKTMKGICQVLSPIKSMDSFPSSEEDLLSRAHLLDLLYFSLVPSQIREAVALEINIQETKGVDNEGKKGWFFKTPFDCIKRAVTSDKILTLVKIPLTIVKNISSGKAGKVLEDLVASAEEVAEEVGKEGSTTAPRAEEIAIPSVSELSKVGIRFRPAKGGLGSIKFDIYTATIHLPTIVLDEKTEVVLRNLIAYEASIAPEFMIFMRYVEMMNGIVDKEEDVAILRGAGIIVNHLKSDSDAAEMWNGMISPVKRTAVPALDNTIQSINTYYSLTWNVRSSTFMKKYIFHSWRFLLFLAANVLLLLAALQAFCSVYNCKRTMVAL